jgi:leucyl-tRNA synthetase
VRREQHRTVERVTQGLERWSFNTAVAAIMEFVNTVSKWARSGHGAQRSTFDEAIDTLLLLLAPMTPHLTAELWEERYPGEPSVHLRSWPVADPDLVQEDTVTMIVEVNGKVRARLEVPPTISEAEAEALALAAGNVQKALDGRTPQRVVVKPPRLVNIIL